jgi:glycosyltransferase involved in cell wall biosynthesis
MRITFVSPAPGMGGGSKVLAIYAGALSRRGHAVRIVSTPLRTLPLRRKVKSLITGNGWPRTVPRPESYLDGSGIEHHVLERFRPVLDSDVPNADVIVATWWETAEWVNALHASKGTKVYFVQGHEVFSFLPIDRCRATYRMPLHKIVVSNWLRDVMRDEYGEQIIDIVPNSVDRTQFHADVRARQPVPTVGLMYSSSVVKGLDVSLAALRMVRQRFPHLRVICFGSYQPDASSPLPEFVEFFLSPPQDQIRHLYAQCDVWLTASRSEGFNLPALEAMACRTPVVATKTGWPLEAIVDGRNGVLVDIDDVSGLARGVEWMLSLADNEWEVLSGRAYETSLAGSWEESARRFEFALEHARERAVDGGSAGVCADRAKKTFAVK